MYSGISIIGEKMLPLLKSDFCSCLSEMALDPAQKDD